MLGGFVIAHPEQRQAQQVAEVRDCRAVLFFLDEADGLTQDAGGAID